MKPSQGSSTRVPLPRARLLRAGWGIARSATALFCMGMALHTAQAQSSPCGISSIRLWQAAIYPPIAKAAHVSGPVIMLVQFDREGLPFHINVVSGPELLSKSATDSVASMRVNTFPGVRECPVVIQFKLGDCNQAVQKSSLTSSTVCAVPPVLDSAFAVTKRRHFILF